MTKFYKILKKNKVYPDWINKGCHVFINFFKKADEENENDIYINKGHSVNKWILNKWKQKTIKEYDCLDNTVKDILLPPDSL